MPVDDRARRRRVVKISGGAMNLGDRIAKNADDVDREGRGLDFLWVELTNRCNLRCVHCYTESHPASGHRDVLTAVDYESLMVDAYRIGCRRIQFIGGEPQLSRDFMRLLSRANEIGFEFIEVFTNLTRLTEDVLRFAELNGICFATSVYSYDPAAHDAITTVRTSHARTIANLKRLINSGVTTRAAMINIRQDESEIGRTRQFLEDLGVGSVRGSHVREFGRGEAVTGGRARMSALCGHCWDGKLCVAPDGVVYPCVMARQWPVGNILDESLAEIVDGMRLKDTRKDIFETAWLPKIDDCAPCEQSCDPDSSSCSPHYCNPTQCPQSCTPQWDCMPDVPR
ncbi:radical SAM protein [Saccharopolyspora sp. K220]|uniref:radical SAM/SPASM domain-containing protein n=1 Tax=Saccharopolyspora soli TaxID=2926618 RepID=UPI001F588278|nr:radical SAM/SPASM domain-containing protein [Saccharopolyspora soli]MCI2421572.1 radical SAM protein [Saccharopolyspora soli]